MELLNLAGEKEGKGKTPIEHLEGHERYVLIIGVLCLTLRHPYSFCSCGERVSVKCKDFLLVRKTQNYKNRVKSKNKLIMQLQEH